MADSPGSNVDPTLMVHPLTGERREFTGVVLEAALSESAKQVKVPCKGRLADALWQVVRASATHAQAGKPSLTAAALALALPTINEATSAYVSGLPRSAGAKATRKRPRRAADAGGGEAPLPEGTVAERAAGAPKRPRDGAEVQPPVAPAARHAAPVRKPSAPSSTAARPADDPLRRLQARRVAELLNRRDWDAGAADKFAGLLRQPAEDQLLVAQSVLHLVTRGKNLALSGCLAHVPEFVAWISSALEARLYGVIDVLCKMLLRFDAASIHACGVSHVAELGRLMKALVAQLAKEPQATNLGEAETAAVHHQRASWRSTAKELFKHLKEAMKGAPTADQPPVASDGSLFGAPSPPSVVPTVPANGGEVARTPVVVQEGAQPMEATVPVVPGTAVASAAEGPSVPALSLDGQAKAAGADTPKLSLPKGVQRRPGSKVLSTFASAGSSLHSTSPAAKNGALNGVDGSQAAPIASEVDSMPHIPKKQPLRPTAAADTSLSPTTAAGSRSSGESPPAAKGSQPSGLLLLRRQDLELPGEAVSESPPHRTASPLAPTSPRLLLSPRPPAPPGMPPLSRAQSQSGAQTGSVLAPDPPRGRSSLPSPRDAKNRAGAAYPVKAIGGSVYDAITEDGGLHEYVPLPPGRGVLRSALDRRGGQRSVTFGADKAWVLPPLSPSPSPIRDAYEAVMDEDDDGGNEDNDGGNEDVGLALKVRHKDVESEAKHFRARHVAADSPAVDALLTLTLQRAFEFFSNNPNLLSDPTPEQLGEVMRDISGSIDLAELKEV